MDVEVIVDSSFSIGLQFGNIKKFLIKLMDGLNIDEDVVRVSSHAVVCCTAIGIAYEALSCGIRAG